ncbi:MAG: hypothetical protein JSV13_09270 [Nitrospiraceae bacterium]|nr:MAG: hypothetical protein JSV13_09270 [Nitrospiraceae bacterium]
MGSRIYECDKSGRLTIYPSLDGPRKRRARTFLKKVLKKQESQQQSSGKKGHAPPKG